MAKTLFPVTLHLAGGDLRVWAGSSLDINEWGPNSIWATVSTFISGGSINQVSTDDGQTVIINWGSVQAVSYSPDDCNQARPVE